MNLPIIHIIGLPGAGKTTLARRLNRNLKIPIYGIGAYRARFPMTNIGEADAWLALFRDLSKRKWRNCILETTGLNIRESFLETSLPLGQMITIKLGALRKKLYQRIDQKKKSERGGNWLYSAQYSDKYAFVRKLYKRFQEIPSDYYIDTSDLDKDEVYKIALKEIKLIQQAASDSSAGRSVNRLSSRLTKIPPDLSP